MRNQTKTKILIPSDKALVVSGVLLMLVQTGRLGLKWTVLHLCSKNIYTYNRKRGCACGTCIQLRSGILDELYISSAFTVYLASK